MSILDSIKKMLGTPEDYEAFDTEIIVHINSALMVLAQLGVGPERPFMITGPLETWEDLLGENVDFEGIKLYVYLRVKRLFDPPQSSFVDQAMNEQIRELEWRLNHQIEAAGAKSKAL